MPLRILFIAISCLMLAQPGAWAAVPPEGKALVASAAPVPIALDGQALLPIVIATSASDAIRASARELATYLQRITGTPFAVEERSEPAGITLGTLEQFPDGKLGELLAIHDFYDGVEAFAIRSDNGRIRLIGNTEKGVAHATWRFLDLLGCRWFFMGKNWEIVPSAETLSFGLNETSRPAIWSRLIWFDRLEQDQDTQVTFERWRQRNRLGHSFEVRIRHAWHRIPEHFRDEFAQHPEYFALVNGQRTGPQFDVTNPGLQDLVIRYAQDYFQRNPQADMVSLDPADQPGWSTDSEWAKLGYPYSAQPFYLANVVARALQKSNPGKFVGLLAYSWYSDPPEFKLEPNVVVQLTRGMNASTSTFEELFERWAKRSGHLGIYEYFSYWEMDQGMLPGSWLNNTAELTQRLRRYAAIPISSISAQSANHWGLYGLSYYLAARQMWDPTADVDTLRRDFLDKAFGPAAPVMARYYERLHAARHSLAGMALIRQNIDDLEAATRLAKEHTGVLARLDELKAYIVYNYLGERVKLVTSLEERRVRLLDWFTWTYRMRDSHMVSWLTFRSAVGRPAAAKFGDPHWFWRNTTMNPEANPWRDETPIGADELASRLQNIKNTIGELPDIAEPETANDFVLIATGRTSQKERHQVFSTGMDFLLASVQGEPLHFTVEQLRAPVVRPDAIYKLTTQAGELITTGQLPIGKHLLQLAVPGPGVYRLSGFSRSSGYRIVFPKELPSAFVFERGRRYRPSGYMAPFYFYVPKDSRKVALYCYECGTIIVRNANDDVVHQQPADGNFVVIPVTTGQDGKVWSLGGDNSMRLRNFTFLELPNVLSSNPDYIFIPRKLAEKDKLRFVIQ